MESDPMKRYSIFSLVGNALSGHQNWPLAWRNPSPKKQYDVVIIGGGGHGLATAYYLAKEHGLRDVAVLEKGWLGGGNTGRNTTIVRSNYHLDPNAHVYDLSLKLWERLSQALNFNVMYSARGVLNLVHTPAEIDAAMRRGNAMRLNGIDAQFLSREEIATRIPNLDCSRNARFPIVGGLLQPRGGTVRHDAVAWGYARAADSLGVDIIQRCEVTGIRIERKAVSGVQTTLGDIGTSKIGIAVAGHSSQVAAMAGVKLPIESHVLQAMVSEPVKPVLDTVVTSGAVHFYISQSDKGELVMGGDLDFYNSYAQRGNLPMIENVVSACLALFPCPYCGPRNQIEFTYGGDATLRRPAPNAPESAWVDYVYLRDNPCGPHDELWYHGAGCRSWFKVRRDTRTHQILESATIDPPQPPDP